MKIITIILLVTITACTYGQKNEIYKGGLKELFKFVGENIQLTSEDKKAKIDGIAIVKFKVVKSSIDSVTVINKITNRIDSEIVRVMKSTNGRWTGSTPGFYLMEIKCTVVNEDRLDTEIINYRLSKAIKKNDLEGIETYRNEIRRRDPFDTNNLKQLAECYTGLNKMQNAEQIENLIKDLNYFSKSGLILGR